MKGYLLEPIDTVFFRDGRPFNAGETGQIEANGTFPPMPATVVGAIRAALARGQGWNASIARSWSNDTKIKAELGDGDDDLGRMRFEGPILLYEEEPVYPAPLCLLGQRIEEDDASPWKDLTRLEPGDELQTDVGRMRLPVLKGQHEALSGLSGTYLAREGMEAVLAGGVPSGDQTLLEKKLWHEEPRLGIKLQDDTKTTGDNAVYQSSHIRLCSKTAIGMHVEGAGDWQTMTPATLGGESRQAWVKTRGTWSLPKAPTLGPEGGVVRYTAILITPGDWDELAWHAGGKQLGDLPGKVVSACVGKPLRMGGWDSLQNKPKPLKSLLPPGSVWFLEAPAAERQAVLSWHGKHLGNRGTWGYGQILIGAWKGAS